MRRKQVINSLIGFFVGIALNVLVGIGISFIRNHQFTLITDHFATLIGQPLLAIFLQVMLSGLCGAWFALISTWIKDEWSYLKQLVVHFCLLAIVFFPITLLLGWAKLDDGLLLGNILTYLLIYFTIYFIVWLTQMIQLKQLVNKLNRKLKKKGK